MDRFGPAWRSCAPGLWEQSSLSASAGGLGLRHARRHGPAAYIASIIATAILCTAIDANYALELTDTLATFNREVPAADRVPSPAPPQLRQQQLSKALDSAEPAGCRCNNQVLELGSTPLLVRRLAFTWRPGSWCSSVCACPLQPARSEMVWRTASATTPGCVLWRGPCQAAQPFEVCAAWPAPPVAR